MKPYILDLDNCLIYSSYSEISSLELISKKGYHFLYHRPGLKSFLRYLIKQKYDLIFYTSSKKEYAKWVVDSFDLEKEYPIFTRFYTKKKITDYGEDYLKSIEKIKVSSRKLIPVLDDRPNLWDEKGIDLIPIDPWHGEENDKSLFDLMINQLKTQQKITELSQTKLKKNGKYNY